MPRRIATPSSPVAQPKPRRAPRPLPLLGAVPDERTAQAMDDERAAAELIADLLALTEAGLIVPVQLAGDICYVLADPDHPAE